MGRRAFSVAALCAAAVVTVSCRDGIEPYALPEHEPVDMAARQVTFGFGQDRDPQWMPDSEMLLYHTDEYSGLPTAQGALLGIDRNGGVALPVLHDIQRTGGRLLATPAVSPDGARIAFIDLMSIDPIVPCPAGDTPLTALCPLTQPLLDSVALRVRRVDTTESPLSDVSLGIKVGGTDPALEGGNGGSYVMQSLPFQQQFRDDRGSVALRPSWSPDNQRIAFSSGLDIHIWRVGDAAATRVPGTSAGVSVAWSPDGERLAFTEVQRVDSVTQACECSRAIKQSEVHARMLYTVTTRVVSIRVDGSDRIVIGEGDEPAWSHDGQAIYMRQGNRIVRVPRSGGTAVPVPNADGGRAPAPSPDGKWLAFAARKVQNIVDWDIWVIAL